MLEPALRSLGVGGLIFLKNHIGVTPMIWVCYNLGSLSFEKIKANYRQDYLRGSRLRRFSFLQDDVFF